VIVALFLWRTVGTSSSPAVQVTGSVPPPPEGGSAAVSTTFAFFDKPRPLPSIRFIDGAGQSRSLADLRGHPLILNIWATWCVPCRQEMPTLNRLQATLKGSVLVVPLSIDSKGIPAVAAFYREIGITSLGIYVDQAGDATHLLGISGIPTTLMIDRDGREIGRKIGPAEWDSPDMVALIENRLQPRAAGAQNAQRP
jgi:thiol-disulfide isomerase/thioredoxin